MLLYVLLLISSSWCQDLSSLDDIRVLSELPIEKLLTLRSGFVAKNDGNIGNITDKDEDVESRILPEALALESKSKLKERGYTGGHSGGGHVYYEEHYDKEDWKKNKVQKIFQISVTALAFLAFGGYLLCLLIHAIKGKQNYTTNPANLQTFATYVATKLKDVKRKKRPRNRRKNLNLKKAPTKNNQNKKRPSIKVKKNQNAQTQKPNDGNDKYIYGAYGDLFKPINRFKRELDESGGFLINDDYLYESLVYFSEKYAKYNTFDYVEYNATKYRNF